MSEQVPGLASLPPDRAPGVQPSVGYRLRSSSADTWPELQQTVPETVSRAPAESAVSEPRLGGPCPSAAAVSGVQLCKSAMQPYAEIAASARPAPPPFGDCGS